MKLKILILNLLVGSLSTIYCQNDIADSLASSFLNQLLVFPQEKIYLHTDKPYYISGERIWFRAHLADAVTHVPVSYSRYVYVELINPLDTVVTRVKIRGDEGVYHGSLLIPSNVPEGDYTLRVYTLFMQSQEEEYFCTKTIRIGDPQARVLHTETRFFFESGRRGRIHVTFRFSSPPQSSSMRGEGAPLIPKSVKVSVNNGKMMNVNVDDDGAAGINFDLPAASRKRVILLEVVAFNHPYRQFIQVPTPDDDFDVSFYPEGGSLMQGTSGMVGFKAMKSNGQATNISGVVYDQTGTEILKFESEHLGMGRFMLTAEKGKTYYAVCENDKGQSKRFDLPAVVNQGYALKVVQLRNNINVSVLKPAEAIQNDKLYLLAHTRGMVYFAGLLNQKLPYVVFPRELFPSGVLHFILFDGELNPVSERLFFIHHQDQAQVNYQPDKEHYAARSLVKSSIAITDHQGEPLTGNFSVSVTSGSEVTPDSTSNILTHLLLTSDLRENIENPAYYFQNSRASGYALDLLMMTQGWRRYNIGELAQGRFAHPTTPVETGPEITGTVKSVLLGQPVESVEVTATSFTEGFIYSALTDKQGRFNLPVRDFPDSTLFTVSAEPKRRTTRMELIIDKEIFPERTLPTALTSGIDKYLFAKYADKAEQKYVDEYGERIYEMQEVVITAQRILPRKSIYYSSPSNTVTEEEIKKLELAPLDIYDVLRRIPGLQFSFNYSPPPRYNIQIRGTNLIGEIIADQDPLILIDNVPMDIKILDMINIFDIEQVDVLKGSKAAIFGSRALNGVISIFTKRPDKAIAMNSPNPLFHIKSVLPLGYQKPAEFYTPKYDTPEKRNAPAPDLRTTIHWQPVVQTDSLGIAAFEFYTADEQTSYTVVIEGLADNGEIIRYERKIWRKEEQ